MKDIIVEPMCATFDQYNRMHYRSCEVKDCHAEAWYTVTRTSEVSGNTYTTRACKRHTDMWNAIQEQVEETQ